MLIFFEKLKVSFVLQTHGSNPEITEGLDPNEKKSNKYQSLEKSGLNYLSISLFRKSSFGEICWQLLVLLRQLTM